MSAASGGQARRAGAVRVTVVVDEEHRPGLAQLCDGLRAQGMQVEQVLEQLGMVTGEVPENRLPSVRRVEGVVSVEPQHRHRIPPPDAPVQ
ncbi:MAG TPA: hypothetical protein VLK55_11805 [Kocuria rosea]|nr:hypothetical protein [Kocuria rosea]